MTDKPEVKRYKYGYKDDGWGQRYLALIEDSEGTVVRLTDHEAARAADKARIAELVRALRKVAGEVDGNIRECVRDCVNQRGNVQDIYDYCDNIDTAIDAVLAQQGKEGGV